MKNVLHFALDGYMAACFTNIWEHYVFNWH